MQQKSELNNDFSEFSRRSDTLAGVLKIRVSDLPEKIGISEDMLMGYRTGRYPISAKAWRKLQVAETSAGMVQKKHDVILYKPDGTRDDAASIANLFELNPEKLIDRANIVLADSSRSLVDRVNFGTQILTLLELKNISPPKG
jgi:NH3-dependent NAD+ synthetase